MLLVLYFTVTHQTSRHCWHTRRPSRAYFSSPSPTDEKYHCLLQTSKHDASFSRFEMYNVKVNRIIGHRQIGKCHHVRLAIKFDRSKDWPDTAWRCVDGVAVSLFVLRGRPSSNSLHLVTSCRWFLSLPAAKSQQKNVIRWPRLRTCDSRSRIEFGKNRSPFSNWRVVRVDQGEVLTRTWLLVMRCRANFTTAKFPFPIVFSTSYIPTRTGFFLISLAIPISKFAWSLSVLKRVKMDRNHSLASPHHRQRQSPSDKLTIKQANKQASFYFKRRENTSYDVNGPLRKARCHSKSDR